MSTPDIRVRLTAEGVNEVIDALRRVQKEGQAANQQAAKGTRDLSSAMGTLRNTLGALGIATSIAGFVGFGKAAFNAAQETSNASKQLHTTTEEFSRLAFAAQASDIEVSNLTAGLSAYQKKLSEAVTEPNGAAAASFQQLGLSAASLRNLSLTDQLKTIADRIAALKDPEDKARASSDLFGKSLGPQFVRVLDEGSAGLARFAEQSDKVGNTLRSSTAAGIDATDAALKRMKASLSGQFQAALGRFALEFERVGMALGFIKEDQIAKAQSQLEDLIALRDKMVANSNGDFSVLQLMGLSPTAVGSAADIEKLNAAIAKTETTIKGLQEGAKPKPAAGGASLIKVETDADRKARADAARASIDQQLKLTEEGFKAQDDLAKRSYDQGLISLQEYFRRREAVIKAQNEAEIAAAEAQIRIIQNTVTTDDAAKAAQAKDIEKLRNDIALKKLQVEHQVADLRGQEITEQKQLTDAQLDFYNKLDELEGNRHQQFERNLATEVEALRRLLTQAGAGPGEIDATVARLQNARTASFNFDETDRASSAQLAGFNRDAAQIRRDQEAGIITQLEGENRLIELERARLVVLKQQAAALQAAALATGDPDKIEQAKQFADSVGEIQASFTAATDAAAKFRQGAETGLREGLRNVFSDAVTGKIHSLGDAFHTLADSIQQSLAQIAADLLSKKLTEGILNFLNGLGGTTGGGGGGLGGFFSSILGFFAGAKNGGELQRLAGGGAVDARNGGKLIGPGTPTSDSMLLLGSRDEFMVRARAAQQPGGLSLLHAINDGRLSAANILRALAIPNIPRFAAGGALSGLTPIPRGAGRGRGDININMDTHGQPVSQQTQQQLAATTARAIAAADRRNN